MELLTAKKLETDVLIIGAGGAGNLYSLTTNLPGITGDGFALGFNAGAKLADIEFMQSKTLHDLSNRHAGYAPSRRWLRHDRGEIL